MKYTVITFILITILCSCNQLHKKEYNLIVAETEGKYLHFSLDDVQECIKNLSNNNYETIFDEPTLSILKDWHERYGIVVSLYIQGDFTVNSKYAKELIANSNWLKFGYHGDTPSPSKKGMERTYKQIMDSIGSRSVIDQCPRIHYFHADYQTAMRLKELGCKGFLTCDDWAWNATQRGTNYYLSNAQSSTLDKNNRLLDTDNNIYFVKTDLRLEHICSKWGGVDALFKQYTNNNVESKELIIFGHEWNFREFTPQADSIFHWAKTNGYEFDYPTNRLPVEKNK